MAIARWFGARLTAAAAMVSSALLLAVFGASALANPAGASCVALPALPDAIAQARFVFVGTVQSTTDADRTADVAVEEIWKGPSLPKRVEVRGSPVSDPGAQTSVDRRFEAGRRYLFVPLDERRGSAFQDNACTSTTEYTPAVAQYAPDKPSAHPRAASPESNSDRWLWGSVAVGAVALVITFSLFFWSRTTARRVSRRAVRRGPSAPAP
jgi:hypothetical protein